MTMNKGHTQGREGSDHMYHLVRKECLEAILNVDREKANSIIEQWIHANGCEQVLESILDPIISSPKPVKEVLSSLQEHITMAINKIISILFI